jgi:hypothetical protein
VPDKSALAGKQKDLLSALNDCNAAIALDDKFGFAYYIRGQIKQMLGHGEYCIDLLTAKKLGLAVETELLKNCGK